MNRQGSLPFSFALLAVEHYGGQIWVHVHFRAEKARQVGNNDFEIAVRAVGARPRMSSTTDSQSSFALRYFTTTPASWQAPADAVRHFFSAAVRKVLRLSNREEGSRQKRTEESIHVGYDTSSRPNGHLPQQAQAQSQPHRGKLKK